MITASDIQRAITRVDKRLLTGQRGFMLVENLPDIAKALSVQIGECCNDCGDDITDDACVIDERMVCDKCYAVRISNADKAEPSAPFMGGGERVIRKTGGLS